MTTQLTLEQRKALVVWMADRSVDTDVNSQERTNRKKVREGLGEKNVHEMAGQEGIGLTD